MKVVISGPSGVGKDAVIKALQASRPDLHFVVTATSRHAPQTDALLWMSILLASGSAIPGIKPPRIAKAS